MSKDKTGINDTPKSKAPWYVGPFKWLFFILAFFLIVFTVLANIGGNNQFYKEAIEQYARNATGYHAEVGQLNDVSFFPSIIFDFEKLELRRTAEDETPVAYASSVLFKMSFWDVALRSGKIKALELREVRALPGAFLQKAIHIKSVSIEEDYLDKEGRSAALVLEGALGKDPIKAYIHLDVFPPSAFWANGKKFRIGGGHHFSVTAGDIGATGDLDKGVFTDLNFTHKDKSALTGKMVLRQKSPNEIVLQADVVLPKHGSKLNPDLKFRMLDNPEGRDLSLFGTLSSTGLHVEDVAANSRIQKFVKSFQALFGSKQKGQTFAFPVEAVDARLDLEKVFVNGKDLGALDVPVRVADKVLTLTLNDKFLLSNLRGDVVLEALESGPSLSIDLNFKDFDYGALQKKLTGGAQLDGKADMALKLNGQAATLGALFPKLSGSYTFVGGQGKLGSSFINLWGGGLLNAIFPDFTEGDRFQVNCAIMDFSITDGLAKSNALFMDTEKLTLAGKGEYDLGKDDLDLTLTPKQKDIAIGDISSSVNVSGPLSKPSISPNLAGIGRKIGTLLLGAVNPAFLAIGLADLGLSEEHPCAAYITVEEPVREIPAVARD